MAFTDPIVRSLGQINATFQLMLVEMRKQTGILQLIADDLKVKPVKRLIFVLGKPSITKGG